MAKLSKGLNEVDRKVASLKQKFEKTTTEAARLKVDLEKAQETIAAAENLVGKLEGEYERWSSQVRPGGRTMVWHASSSRLMHCSCLGNTVISAHSEQVGELTKEIQELPMRALLGAAFLTYMSAAPEDVRQLCLSNWMEAVGVTNFDLRRFLSTESEQLIWKSEGLPSDDLSMENALVILQVRARVSDVLNCCICHHLHVTMLSGVCNLLIKVLHETYYMFMDS